MSNLEFEIGLIDIIQSIFIDEDEPQKTRDLIIMVMESWLWRWKDKHPEDEYRMVDAERVLYNKFRDIYILYKGESNE